MEKRHWIIVLALLLMATAIKAHMFFIRLLILAAAGLAGLFLLHILATDYRKIQASRPKVLGLFKRSIEGVHSSDIDTEFSATQQFLEEDRAKLSLLDTNNLSLLGAAAHLDPYGCTRRYVCSIAARPQQSLSMLEKTVLELIQTSQEDAAPLQDAMRLGRKLQDVKACSARFSRCTYSVTEMLRLIQPVY